MAEHLTEEVKETSKTSERLSQQVAEYDVFMGEVTSAYNARLTHLTEQYQQAFNEEVQHPGTQNIDQTLQQVTRSVYAATERVGDHVKIAVQGMAKGIPQSLSAGDRRILADAKNYLYGTVYTPGELEHMISGADEQAAIRVALDEEVLRALNRTRYDNAPDRLEKLSWLWDQVSSSNVRHAMLASWDHDTATSLQFSALSGDYAYSRYQHESLQAVLNRFSSEEVKTAMHCFIDANVWQRLQSPQQHAPRNFAQLLLNQTSQSVYTVFQKIAPVPPSQKDSSKTKEKAQKDPQQQQEPEQQPEPTITEEDLALVEQVLFEVIAVQRRTVTWLARIHPSEVLRVINVVKRIRHDDPDVTDSKIYRMLRTKTEAGMQDSSGTADKQAIADFQILKDLMGSFKGHLPNLNPPPDPSSRYPTLYSRTRRKQ